MHTLHLNNWCKRTQGQNVCLHFTCFFFSPSCKASCKNNTYLQDMCFTCHALDHPSHIFLGNQAPSFYIYNYKCVIGAIYNYIFLARLLKSSKTALKKSNNISTMYDEQPRKCFYTTMPMQILGKLVPL